MPIGTIIGLAVSVGAGIWKRGKAQKALHNGKTKEQLILIMRYQRSILGDFSTKDYGKMNGQLYPAATDFFTGLLGVPVEEDNELQGIFGNGGKDYHVIRNGKWKHIPLKDAQIANQTLMKIIGPGWKRYDEPFNQDKQLDLLKWTDPTKVPGHSQYNQTVKTGGAMVTAPNEIPQEEQYMEEFTTTAKLENPLKTYWWAFLTPVVFLLGLLWWRAVKKR